MSAKSLETSNVYQSFSSTWILWIYIYLPVSVFFLANVINVVLSEVSLLLLSYSIKIRLDLTKKHYLMLSEVNKLASHNQDASFCYVDANCRLKISWNDNQEDFFDTLEGLRDFLTGIIKFLYNLLELLLVKFVF